MNDYAHYAKEELVHQLAASDHLAFTEIYNRYWKRLYVLAFDRLRAREQAEDVVQDVFAGLWQRREQTIVRNLDAYLATACRYAVFTQLSKNASAASMPVDALPEALQGVQDETAQLHFLQRSMQEQLKQLPEKCRIVFDYSRNAGLSNREIAHQLSISEKSVEKHITKALQRLRLQFKNYMHLFFF